MKARPTGRWNIRPPAPFALTLEARTSVHIAQQTLVPLLGGGTVMRQLAPQSPGRSSSTQGGPDYSDPEPTQMDRPRARAHPRHTSSFLTRPLVEVVLFPPVSHSACFSVPCASLYYSFVLLPLLSTAGKCNHARHRLRQGVSVRRVCGDSPPAKLSVERRSYPRLSSLAPTAQFKLLAMA